MFGGHVWKKKSRKRNLMLRLPKSQHTAQCKGSSERLTCCDHVDHCEDMLTSAGHKDSWFLKIKVLDATNYKSCVLQWAYASSYSCLNL